MRDWIGDGAVTRGARHPLAPAVRDERRGRRRSGCYSAACEMRCPFITRTAELGGGAVVVAVRAIRVMQDAPRPWRDARR